MHHFVFGINFQIHSVRLTSLVSIHLLIHLSAHLCHQPHSHHPSLLHSYARDSKPTFSTNPSHRRIFYLLDCLMITGLYRTYHAPHFIFSFKVFQNTHYRIVSCRPRLGIVSRGKNHEEIGNKLNISEWSRTMSLITCQQSSFCLPCVLLTV